MRTDISENKVEQLRSLARCLRDNAQELIDTYALVARLNLQRSIGGKKPATIIIDEIAKLEKQITDIDEVSLRLMCRAALDDIDAKLASGTKKE